MTEPATTDAIAATPVAETATPPPAAPARRSRRGWIVGGATVLGLIVLVFLVLALLDWNMLRGPIARFASAQTHRPIRIDGNLKVKVLSWTPSATIEGLKIGNPNGTPGDLADIQKLAISVKLLPLFKGQVVLPLLSVDQPNVALLSDARGVNNWTFKGKSPGEPTRLPAIQRFEINDGKLKINDQKRKMVFSGTISSSEVVDARRVEGFRLRGDGQLNGEAFKLNLGGGPLLNVDPHHPYPFDADVTAGPSRILAKGSITKPFDLGAFTTSLTASGQDLANLYDLTGVAFPNTPPYKLSGQLTRHDHQFDYSDINGRVGDSDLHGKLGVDVEQRIMLTGDLTSQALDFADLATILGGAPPPKAGAPRSAEENAISQHMAATQRLLPDATLKVDRLRGMDAAVKYRAVAVKSDQFPVKSASVDLKLDHGVLTLNQLTFGLNNGQVAGMVAIDARQDVPLVNVDMRLTGARIEQFLPARFSGNAIQGSLVGRAKLSGRGRSVHEAAAAANGTVTLVMPNGEIRAAFAELLGVNVVKGLGLLLSKNQEKADIRCGVADFQARNGTLFSDTLVFDTQPVLAQGGGTIDLRSERMDLRIKGKPKQFRLVRLMLPITLQGHLISPKLGVDASAAAGQVGLAAAVGAALSPLAAILPFVDAGLAKDANCQGLLQDAGKPGARVPTATPAAKTRP